jgi:hypothetical protein
MSVREGEGEGEGEEVEEDEEEEWIWNGDTRSLFLIFDVIIFVLLSFPLVLESLSQVFNSESSCRSLISITITLSKRLETPDLSPSLPGTFSCSCEEDRAAFLSQC